MASNQLSHWVSDRIKDLGERQHLLMALCLIMPVAVLGMLFLAGVKGNYAFWVFLVACPLMHFAMMRGGKKCH